MRARCQREMSGLNEGKPNQNSGSDEDENWDEMKRKYEHPYETKRIKVTLKAYPDPGPFHRRP